MTPMTSAPGNSMSPDSSAGLPIIFCTNIGKMVSEPIMEIIVKAMIVSPTANCLFANTLKLSNGVSNFV